jgi:hypothetical protein
MKFIKTTLLFGVLFLLISSFSKCSSSKSIVSNDATDTQIISKKTVQMEAPLEMGKIEYRKWTSGIQNGGSGIHMYITVLSNKSNIQLDSVHFQGMRAKISIGKMGYYAGFISPENQREDTTMSNDEHGEYGNKLPELSLASTFNLKNDECMISYLEKDKIKYFKVANLIEKQAEFYPSSPTND